MLLLSISAQLGFNYKFISFTSITSPIELIQTCWDLITNLYHLHPILKDGQTQTCWDLITNLYHLHHEIHN